MPSGRIIMGRQYFHFKNQRTITGLQCCGILISCIVQELPCKEIWCNAERHHEAYYGMSSPNTNWTPPSALRHCPSTSLQRTPHSYSCYQGWCWATKERMGVLESSANWCLSLWCIHVPLGTAAVSCLPMRCSWADRPTPDGWVPQLLSTCGLESLSSWALHKGVVTSTRGYYIMLFHLRRRRRFQI